MMAVSAIRSAVAHADTDLAEADRRIAAADSSFGAIVDLAGLSVLDALQMLLTLSGTPVTDISPVGAIDGLRIEGF